MEKNVMNFFESKPKDDQGTDAPPPIPAIEVHGDEATLKDGEKKIKLPKTTWG